MAPFFLGRVFLQTPTGSTQKGRLFVPSEEYGWSFLASDVDPAALENAEEIVARNELQHQAQRDRGYGLHLNRRMFRSRDWSGVLQKLAGTY